jgi:DNA replication protein DnaC
MRLYGIHTHFEARAMSAINQGQSHLEFLHLLLEDEKNTRKDKFGKSLTKRARFRYTCELEDWDINYDRGITKAQLKELSTLSFYRVNTNLLLLGKTGEGKTHLAVSLGKRLCNEGISVAFLPMCFLFEHIQSQKLTGKLLGYLGKLAQTKVLILDDFGLRNYSHEEATILVEILEARSKKGPVIVTSQVNPKAWTKLFEDPAIAEAIVDRLLNPSTKINLKGGSYREKIGCSEKLSIANDTMRH